MTTTAYLDLFLRSVTEPALLQTFLSFILLHRHESVHILDTLVSRINTPFQVEDESRSTCLLLQTHAPSPGNTTPDALNVGTKIWQIVAMATLSRSDISTLTQSYRVGTSCSDALAGLKSFT